MMKHLKALCALDGVSGAERPVREYILNQLAGRPFAKAQTDPLGNVLARLEGRERAGRTVLFAAHMDEVGLIVTGATEEGFLRFAAVGGVDPAVVYGRRVTVGGRPGVIGGRAIHQCAPDDKDKLPPLDKLLIDVGAATRDEALAIARPGDRAVFEGDFIKMAGGLVRARALDDRAGCALLLALAVRQPAYDLTLAFTVQEEVGLRGAAAAAFAVAPDVAVVVDATTAADTAGVPADRQVCRAGGGPAVSFMDGRTLYDRALYDFIMAAAERAGIKAQTKTLIAGGNDAGAIQRAGAGARVAAVSLPCRYLHSPACVLSKKDLEATAKLLALLGRELADPAADPAADLERAGG